MRRGGFSLLELSVVLVIVSLVAAAGLTLGNDAIKSSERVTTQERLLVVRSALDFFFRQNGYLPCPANRALRPNDTGFGAEQRNSSNLALCVAIATNNGIAYAGGSSGFAVGALPVRTLGLPDTYAADAWSNKFTYSPNINLVSGPSAYNQNTNSGLLVRYSATQDTTNAPVDNGLATHSTGYAAFVVVSHGPDGRGAFALNGTVQVACTGVNAPPPCNSASDTACVDIENCNDNATFFDGTYNDSPTNHAQYYDDFMVWQPATLQRTPLSTTPVGCSSGCERWCAPCQANKPADPLLMNNPVLCRKVILSTVPCAAVCLWSGYTANTGAGTQGYQPCP